MKFTNTAASLGSLKHLAPLPSEIHRPIPTQYGSSAELKSKGHIRVFFQNTHGLPTFSNDPKNISWSSRISRYRADIVLLAETNVNWSKTCTSDSLCQRNRRFWAKSRTTVAWNVHSPSESPYLAGGTANILLGDIANRSTTSGTDPTGLGRWTWNTLIGPNKTSVIVVSAYVPTHSTLKSKSVAAQHTAYLRSHNDDRSAKTAFFQDLGTQIKTWHQDGAQVILGLDANCDVSSHTFKTWHKDIGLENAISTLFDDYPATYHNGTAAIDAILVSAGLSTERGGLIPSHDCFDSDHSGLWIDINPSETLGKIQRSPPRQTNRLNTTNKAALSRYLQLYEAHIDKHNLVQRCLQLVTRSKQVWNAECIEELEAIDKLRTAGMMDAESRCRRLRMGNLEWSEELSQAMRDKKLVIKTIRRQSGLHVSSSLLHRLRSRASNNTVLFINEGKLTEALSEVKSRIRKIKKASSNANRCSILRQAQAAAKFDGQPTKLHFKRIEHASKDKRMFSTLRTILRPPKRSVYILATNSTDGTLHEACTKKPVENIALAEGEARFRRTEKSPFMLPNLSNRLGFRGEGPDADNVLNGTFQAPDSIDDHTLRLLRQLQRPAGITEHQSIITPEEWKNLWLKCRENTATGDSGLTFAMFRANCLRRKTLLVDTTLASLSYHHGHALRRWKRSINVLIQKKQNSVLAEKQRIIHLWEADANAIFKILARHAINIARDNGLLAPEQYGSCPEFSAQALSLAKRLIFDIARQRRDTIAICCNDAKQCYDRIVHTPAALALRRVGIKEGPIRCMFSMIHALEHHVRTGHGTSKDFFSTSVHINKEFTAIPIQGIGQGNGCGPTTWAILSSVLLNIMRTLDIGWKLSSPISVEDTLVHSFAFVDDTDTIEGARSELDSFQSVTARLQKAVDVWSGSIRATGGDISAEKSFWTLLDFKFDKHGKPISKKSSEIPAELKMNEGNSRFILKRIEASEAIMTLGVYLAANGDETAQKKHLESKVNEWCNKISRGNLHPEYILEALRSTIGRTLAYPCAVTTFTQKQCDEITKDLRRRILPLLGYNCHIPRCIVHANREDGGLGFPDLYAEQLAQRAKMIVEHGTAKTTTGRLIRTSLELLKLEIGNGEPLHRCEPKEWADFTTDCWIKSTWMDSTSAGLCFLDPTPNLPLPQSTDRFINTVAREAGFTPEQRRRINHCRLFFQISCLSELSTEKEGIINKHFTLYHKGKPSAFSTRWPRQKQPSRADHRAWTLFLSHVKTAYLSIPRPEAAWCRTLHYSLHNFDLLSSTGSHLYCRNGSTWSVWSKQKSRYIDESVYRHTSNIDSLDLPENTRPTYNSLCYGRRTVSGPKVVTPETPPSNTFADFLSKLPDSTRWSIDLTSNLEEANTLAKAMQSGTLAGVSDGSLKDGVGTSAWIVTNAPFTEGNKSELEGRNVVPGNAILFDSCRAELCGVLGIVTIADALSKFFRIGSGNITVCLDSQSAIDILRAHPKTKRSSGAHWDITNEIFVLTNSSPINFSYRHVRGHQDAHKDSLDVWESLNVRMDEAAKAHRFATNPSTIPTTTPIGSVFLIANKQGTISKRIRNNILPLAQSDTVRTYYGSKLDISPTDMDSFNWKAKSKAHQKCSRHITNFVIKHTSGFSTAGHKLLQLCRGDGKCPLCQTLESEAHIYGCRSEKAVYFRGRERSKLFKRIAQLNTPPSLLSQIQAKLSETNDDTDRWRTLMGCIPIQWETEFNNKRLRHHITGSTWSYSLILLLWDFAHVLWNFRTGFYAKLTKMRELNREEKDLNDSIRLFHGKSRLHMSGHDKSFLNIDLPTLLQSTPQHRKAWLRTAREIHFRLERKLKEQYGAERSLLQNWLT